MKIFDRLKYDLSRIKNKETLAKYILLVITIVGGLTKNVLVLLIAGIGALYALFDYALNEDIKFLQWRNKKNYPGMKSQERKLWKWIEKQREKI